MAFVNRLAALNSLDEQLEALVAMTSEATEADRSSIFLHDASSGELYSRVALGDHVPEIRVPDTVGIVGLVFTTGTSVLIPDAYADERFNPSVDEKTGYRTQDVLCTPIRTRRGELLGVAQALNKTNGRFTRDDLTFLEAVMQQASIVLHGTLSVAKMLDNQRKEAEFLNVVAEISSEIQLGRLLQMIMSMVTKILNAERSTLFLNDEKTNELYTEVGEGLGATRIRFPNRMGIAGTVFQTGETVNIPYAYADLRFNPAFDKQTGFFTRSLLCVPVTNKAGKAIGVTQVLNKIGGTFKKDDEVRLKAFTAQISIALENAKLFDDIQSIKNYNESILESMSNGVVTFDVDERIVTCNQAGLRILGVRQGEVLARLAADFFQGKNAWVVESIRRVKQDRTTAITMDAEIAAGTEKRSVNVTVLPLTSGKGENLGSMMLIEDISSEKRLKSTMARYMDPGLADKLLQAGEDILGGQARQATVLFSDVRNFTTLTEELGAQGTVALLNEYFTIMVECIQREGGMLDKFIGDAIMAVFGTPLAHDDDPDRGVRAAISMMRELGEYNRDRASRGRKLIDMGIGLNTDHVVSGNIGSPKRMDYTVIGDGVNLASRLESACKQYGAHILISQNTLNQLRGTYRTREIDSVVVKGKTEPVRVYEVLDYHTEGTFPAMVDVLNHFRNGIELYRLGNWDKAVHAFREALRHHPADKASQLYVQRCEHLKKHPPLGEWKGVWVMESK
ncbi:MAG: GAF domain-containing protein [Planctomycetes bacterium]|nr:GAF domain-containing protein [Planctomycetota bacterium]